MILGRAGASIDLTSISNTELLEEPKRTENLVSDQYALVLKDRHLKNCFILDTSEDYTKIKTVIGPWWIKNQDWIDSNIPTSVPPYLESGGFRFLPDTPYIHHPYNGVTDAAKSLSCTLGACLLQQKLFNNDTYEEYVSRVDNHGDSSKATTHLDVLRKMGIPLKFVRDLDESDIKETIDRGLSIPVGLVIKGTPERPRGFTYCILIYGYSDTHWLAHDSIGRADIQRGFWVSNEDGSGKAVTYDIEESRNRIFFGGGCSAFGWLNCRKN